MAMAFTLAIHHAGDARLLQTTPIYECFVALITSRLGLASWVYLYSMATAHSQRAVI